MNYLVNVMFKLSQVVHRINLFIKLERNFIGSKKYLG